MVENHKYPDIKNEQEKNSKVQEKEEEARRKTLISI